MIAKGAAVVKADKSRVHNDRRMDATDDETDADRAITIKMSWVRNAVAVAAAFLAFFIMSQPVSNGGVDEGVSMSQVNLPIIHKSHAGKADAEIDTQVLKEDTLVQEEDRRTT